MSVRVLVILGVLVASHAFAGAFTPIVISSPDTTIIVRIEPGGTTKAIGRFAQQTKYPSARATFFRLDDSPENYTPYQKIYLSNLMPFAACVSNDGVLATLDIYVSPDYRDIVSIYDPHGNKIRTYSIDEIYTESTMSERPRGMSGEQWWHPTYRPRFRDGAFWVMDIFGNYLIFSTTDGSLSTKGERSEHIREEFR